MSKPVLKIIGADGNAFAILGVARRTAREAGWDKEKIEKFFAEAVAGDYDHLLNTCSKYFEVE